jgi:hypothetical protein
LIGWTFSVNQKEVFLLLKSLTVAEDKNSILTCLIRFLVFDPVPSVRGTVFRPIQYIIFFLWQSKCQLIRPYKVVVMNISWNVRGNYCENNFRCKYLLFQCMVFNATFNNISAISRGFFFNVCFTNNYSYIGRFVGEITKFWQ